MEKERRYYAGRLEDEVRTLEGYVKQNKATIQRFKAESGNEALAERIKNLKAKVAEHESQIEEKTTRASEIRLGLHDDELRKKSVKATNATHRRHEETMKVKREKEEDKAKRKAESDRVFQSQRNYDRNDRQHERDQRYEYRRFVKMCNTIPDYINKNLEDMPHNKGYIWRGIWLFGKKPEEPGKPQIMFERKNKDILLIHECDEYESRVYEKRGKNRKVLIERKPRRIIAGAPVNGRFPYM